MRPRMREYGGEPGGGRGGRQELRRVTVQGEISSEGRAVCFGSSVARAFPQALPPRSFLCRPPALNRSCRNAKPT
eukprot:1412565-Rhodomonas_salina.1